MLDITVKKNAILLILAITISIVSNGCLKSSEIKLDPKNPVTIVVWHYYHGAQKTYFDSAVEEFNDTLGFERGIIIEAVSHGGVNELAQNVISAAKGELDADNMPNIFGSYSDTALQILNMGMVADINDYITEAELAEYEEQFIEEGRLGTDNLYVFPIAKSTESLMLNKTDFDAFAEGLAASGSTETVSYDDLSTWEGIIKTAAIYYDYTDSQTPDIANDGKAFMGIDSLANYITISSKQLGQDLVEVTNGIPTINLDAEIMSKVWYTYYEPTVRGLFTKLGRFCSDDIKTGDTLCFVGSTTGASYFPTELMLEDDEIKNIELIVLPMPVFEGGSKVAVSQGAGMVITKSTIEKEYASSVFLKWFTELDRNVSFSLGSSYLPVKKRSLDESVLSAVFETISSGDIGIQNSIKALKVGIEQLREYTMYTSDAFDGSVDFRLNLPTALETASADDSQAYAVLLQSGMSPDQAYAEIYAQSRAKYDEWILSLGEYSKTPPQSD